MTDSTQTQVSHRARNAGLGRLVPIASLLVHCAAPCPQPAHPEAPSEVASSQPMPPPVSSTLVASPPATASPSAEAPAPLAPTPPPSNGGLTPEQVRSVVMGNVHGFQACYERALATDASIQGGVTISFSVAPDGALKGASVSSSSLGNPKVEECMLSEFEKLRFPAAQKQTNASFPFVFKGGGR